MGFVCVFSLQLLFIAIAAKVSNSLSLEHSACPVAEDLNLGIFHSVASNSRKIFMAKKKDCCGRELIEIQKLCRNGFCAVQRFLLPGHLC